MKYTNLLTSYTNFHGHPRINLVLADFRSSRVKVANMDWLKKGFSRHMPTHSSIKGHHKEVDFDHFEDVSNSSSWNPTKILDSCGREVLFQVNKLLRFPWSDNCITKHPHWAGLRCSYTRLPSKRQDLILLMATRNPENKKQLGLMVSLIIYRVSTPAQAVQDYFHQQ